jgi:hypothetical protein
MIPGDHECNHVRLRNYAYLTHPADIEFHRRLCLTIVSLAGPDSDLATRLPRATEMHAWSRAYAIYQSLLNREKRSPSPEKIAQIDAARVMANINLWWNTYLRQRLEVFELVRRDEIDNQTALYLGLKPGDLDPPNNPDAEQSQHGFERHPQWQERASRISDALSRWRDMSATEKVAIPQVMAARAEIQKLQVRLASIETNQKEHAA